MRYPRPLQENGTIGFVAPSFGCATEPYRTAFDHALQHLEGMGYRTKLGPNCYLAEGIGISNEPSLCGSELNEFYCSKENDVLLSCGGGELMCEVVPYIDFERIKKEDPKWYMGYSDNTNFTFLLTTLCDTASIYGPCASELGMEPWHASIEDAWKLLCGQIDHVMGYDMWEKEHGRDEEHPLAPYNLTENRVIRKFPDQDAQMEGRLIGGCIDCLINLLGTQFDQVNVFNEKYKEDGFIWFLEACDLNPMSIRRAIWQMKHAGWFEYVKGFLIGRPMHFGEEILGVDQYNAVTELLGEYGVPIIMDLDIGHLSPKMPIVCGSTAKVDAYGNEVKIQYTWN